MSDVDINDVLDDYIIITGYRGWTCILRLYRKKISQYTSDYAFSHKPVYWLFLYYYYVYWIETTAYLQLVYISSTYQGSYSLYHVHKSVVAYPIPMVKNFRK